MILTFSVCGLKVNSTPIIGSGIYFLLSVTISYDGDLFKNARIQC